MAGRLLLTTVGTSAFDRLKLDHWLLASDFGRLQANLPPVHQGVHRRWLEQLPHSLERFIASYAERASRESVKDHLERLAQGSANAYSAEITSLHLANAGAEDRVVLLVTDTPKGVLAANLCRRLLEQSSLHVECELIEGLRPDNLKEFLDSGLEHLEDRIVSSSESHPQHEPVFNITGGFKALIPALTYIAISNGAPVFLSFEEEARLVWLDTYLMRSSLSPSNSGCYVSKAYGDAQPRLKIPKQDTE
ncbi:MAG: hypothetical protein ACO1SX_08455 [Actinomycetota bacterium]